jgi:hypothetical protein
LHLTDCEKPVLRVRLLIPLQQLGGPSSTPLTIRSLKGHADYLRTELDHLEVPTSFIDNMNTYLKAQANAGAQAQGYLHTQAVELARQKRTRRSLLKGMLYASEARSIVHQREEAEVEKADLALHRAQLAVKRRLKRLRITKLVAISS